MTDESHFQVFYADADRLQSPDSNHVAVFSSAEGAEAFIDAWNDAHPEGSVHDLQEFDGPIYD